METKLDLSGEMSLPGGSAKTKSGGFDFSNIGSFSSKLPSIAEALQVMRKNIRPWSDFLNTQNFKTVGSLPRLSSRYLLNISYFQSNYLCIFLVLMIYCLVTSPLILIALTCSLYICYRIRKAQSNFTIFGKELNCNQQCIVVNVATIPILYIVGAGTALFWTIGASFFLTSLHAIFYNIDSIVTEDSESFLSEVV